MASGLDFLNNISDLGLGVKDQEEFELRTQTENLLFPEGFTVAPVAEPHKFCADIKAAKAAPGLTDFKHGTTTLAFRYKGGIVVAVDSRASMGTFISSQQVKKILHITPFIIGTMAGGAADCAYWERHLARVCRLHELNEKERITVAGAANILASIFYQYRGYGLSCGTMVAGWDKTGAHLFYVDDNGTRLEGNRFSVGSGSTYAYGVLDSGYHWDLTDEEAVELGRRSIYQATHRDGASGGVVRVYHITEKGWTPVVPGKDVNELHWEYAEKEGKRGDIM